MIIENTIRSFEEKIRRLVTFLYSWLTNEGEPLGYILGVCHITICVSLIFMIIISHTLYPAFWLQCVVFVFIFIIWIQHIFLKVCVVILAEYSLTKNESPFYKLITAFTTLNPQDWTIHFMVAETITVICLTLEITSTLINYFYRKIGFNI